MPGRTKKWKQEAEGRYRQLLSVAEVLREEQDKLNRKWPEMIVSDLLVSRTNKVITEVKDLLAPEGDSFVETTETFVAAGDNPEIRDVVLVLAEICAALERFRRKNQRDWQRL